MSCYKGCLRVAQWLDGNHEGAETVKDLLKLMCTCCENGHLSIVQWLSKRFQITTKSWGNDALRACCAKGHLDVAQWLVDQYHLTTEDLRANHNLSCEKGHFEMSQWLADRFQLTTEDVRFGEFYYATMLCTWTSLDVSMVSRTIPFDSSCQLQLCFTRELFTRTFISGSMASRTF